MKTLATYLFFAALLLTTSVSQGAELGLTLSRSKAAAAEYPQYRFQEIELTLAIEEAFPYPPYGSVGVNDLLRPGANQFAGANLFGHIGQAGQATEPLRIDLSAAKGGVGAFNPSNRVNLPLRYSGVSPYLYAGGSSREFNLLNWMVGGGLGLEYRLARLTSVFADGRFSWSDRSPENERMLMRGGVNFGF